mmetsp:Transcript_13888/g.29245  ORF Transcript_13888/g.29245 Transcript_13888/m.29245 type:complete len:246 (-) Transcript_13888:955-1692(-)
MHAKNFLSTLQIGSVDRNLTIEPTGAGECLIQNIYAIRAGQNHHTGRRAETVHFDEKLIECVFPFIVSTRETTTSTLATNRIDFVDENYAGCVCSGLLEKISHPRRPDSHKHFNEIRATDGIKRNPGFTGHCFGQERLACAGRSAEKSSLRRFGTQFGELFRRRQELDKFHHFKLCLLTPGHVFKGDIDVFWIDFLGVGFSYLKHSTRATTASHASRGTSTHESSRIVEQNGQDGQHGCQFDEFL